MPLAEKQKVLFVVNGRSGRKGVDRLPLIKNWAEEEGVQAFFFEMPKKNCGQKLSEKLEEVKPSIAVAVGGDGTVSLVAGLIKKTPVKLAILPAGSANGMARELEIPEDTRKALELISQGRTIKSDLVLVNGEWLCMHLSDIGLNARLIKYFDQGPVRGLPGYALALIKALRRRQRLRITVQTPGGEKQVNALMVLFANASKYGTGATINFQCSLTDRLFEVVIVKKLGLAEIWKMFFGKRGFDPRNIEVLSATRVLVETEKPAHLQVDGEYAGKVTAVEAIILRETLEVFVPESKVVAEGG